MNRQLLHQVFLVWLCLLAACEGPNTDVSPKQNNGIPERTTTGADILVCMVNANLQLEVYSEQSEYLFSSDDISAARLYTSNIPVLKLAARQRPKDDPTRETHINFAMRMEDPQVNTTYNVYATYSGPRGVYTANNTSVLRFSRIDSFVAAGDFSFVGISANNDSMRFSGYFDIPFIQK